MSRSFRDALSIEEIEIGRDITIVIKGGDAHIGAVSTAYVANKNPVVIEVETTSVPGHKEYLLSENFARRSAMKLLRTVTVIVGIHFDNLNKNEIDVIVQTVESMFENYLAGKISGNNE
ncbi:hypothetical protein [Paenibacillus faecalis]|uniref:prenylated flavin chaperone LpdD n=1 Tax=Paenibacillus faecalis TaxID=2079532 RepID=UPI000D1125F9|nr:hypothetical protein [Paenibacillus faecalis]